MPPANWLLFTTSLPAARRARRAFVSGVLREEPEQSACAMAWWCCRRPTAIRARFGGRRRQIEQAGGVVWLLELYCPTPWCRGAVAGAIRPRGSLRRARRGVASLRSKPRLDEASLAGQRLRKLQRDLQSITEIDFFPGGAQRRQPGRGRNHRSVESAVLAPGPAAMAGEIIWQLDPADYRGRLWRRGGALGRPGGECLVDSLHRHRRSSLAGAP